ncbi:MAG TPA: hypothetical protein PKN33_02340 [Phycisphaerae bacterium]|nr:hypothetical protein [Phycisphaerales bacterium]HNO76872.1 hypothetical protein [Phycisphaerae bacterium]
MQQLRLIGLSSFISLLIWVVADVSMSETETIKVWISAKAVGIDDMHVEKVSDDDTTFDVTFTGPKSAIASLRQSAPLRVEIPISPRASGVYTLKLDSELSADASRFPDVIVQEVKPPTMEVQVIRDKTVKMLIKVTHESLKYDTEPVVEPSEVSVKISELDLAQIPEDSRRVYLDADEHLRTAERGKMLEKVVPLRPEVADFPVQLDPEYVTLRARLKEDLREETLAAVPIRIEASMDIFNAFNVEVRDAGAILTQTITIKAPIEVIERIHAKEDKVYGVISIGAEDKTNADEFRFVTPQFSFPPGVSLVGEPELIEFRLISRKNEIPPSTAETP